VKSLVLLFNDETVLHGSDPFDDSCNLNRFIDGPLRTNEAAHLNDALVGFHTDPE